MGDATEVVQRSINSACDIESKAGRWASIKFENGDYLISMLQVPASCKLLLFGEGGSKLIHIGGRRQPLFVLGKDSLLKLQNLDIDYKGNERFMFQGRQTRPPNVQMENVNINRVSPTPAPPHVREEPGKAVSPAQLLNFLKHYIESYRKECESLTAEEPAGAGFPSEIMNKAYIDSRLIRGYLLRDGVVIADVVEIERSDENYELDDSMEIIPAKLRDVLEDGTRVEVILAKHSISSFLRMVTLGLFNVQAIGAISEYGRHSSLSKFRITNDALKRERYVSYIAWYPYLDKAGWHDKNAWIYAFYDVRYDVAGAIATQEKAGKVYKTDTGGEVIATPTDVIWREYDIKTRLGAKLAKFSGDVREFEHLLEESGNSEEKKFLKYLDDHPHLLDLYAVSIHAQPFLEIPESQLSAIEGIGRMPDYIAKHRDDTYTLIEVERPSKPIFVGKDVRPSYGLTQAVNQVSTWDEIIRRFGDYLRKFPGIRNHSSLVIIGRENVRRFNSPEEFRSELNRINQQYDRIISIITFDELVERAKTAIANIRAIRSFLG